VFDDNFEHEVWNLGDRPRVVLVVDMWHPDLTEEEIHLLNGLQRYAIGNRLDLSTTPVPDGFHTVTLSLVVRDARGALEFYRRAFSATILRINEGPSGKVIHALFRIGDSVVVLADEFPDRGSYAPQATGGKLSTTLHLYVPDVDASFKRAVDAGASVATPLRDAFWGDRYGQVIDPYGYKWSIATRKRTSPSAEMAKAQRDAFSKMDTKNLSASGNFDSEV
jgi:PhnB protein